MTPVVLDGLGLTAATLERVAVGCEPIELAAGALAAVAVNRAGLEAAIGRGDAIYGITTGLGAFVDSAVSPDAVGFQRDILRSHAAGVGVLLPREQVRGAIAARLNCLLRGHSGIRPLVLERIAALLNDDLVPAVPRTGSVGASGDLAPSAHAFLPLVGEGEMLAEDGTVPAAVALRGRSLEPLELEPKEALALINGTHFMAGIGALGLMRASRLGDAADGIGALSLEALRAAPAAFEERIHALRPVAGQVTSAAVIRTLTEGSERMGSGGRVQDAYSLRCLPQVHGAFREACHFAERLVTTDLNAVTDNPIVFDDPLEVVSGGNFHGQSLALAFDVLRIALADLAAISERRTFRLLSPTLNGDLPAFLAREPGTQHGYMLAQITAAAVLGELRALAHPVSCDTVPTSDNQEDHVSMGMTAATLLSESVARAETVVAIEALCAAQAIDVTEGAPGVGTARLLAAIRERVPPLGDDRPPAIDIEKVRRLVEAGSLASHATRASL